MSRRTLVVVTALAVTPVPGFAQAWLPPKGEATIAFAYQYTDVRDHINYEGNPQDGGRMRWNHMIADLGYGITDRLALSVRLPYVVSKYTGTVPHRPPGRPGIDDAAWHGTFQDLGFEARFMATTGSLVVTPFIGGGLPSANYETHAHVAAGRGVWEIAGGVNVGRRLDPVLPDGYAQGRVAFTVAERVLDISHNRTNASLELGYFVLPALTVRAMGSWQVTHGGLRVPIDTPPGTIQFLHHDQLNREGFFNVSLGLGYAATGSLDVFAMAVKTVSGQSTLDNRSISAGFAYNFSPARLIKKRRTALNRGAAVP